MKIFRFTLLASMMTIFCVFSTIAQQNNTNKKIYENILVDSFSIKQGVDFPSDKTGELTQSLTNSLTETNKFKSVSISNPNETTDKTATPAPALLRISGEIIKYDKGSQAKRYLLGMGAGKTKIIANIKFIDAESGKVVFEEIVDGIVSWGLFGGDKDQAQNNLSKQIVKIVKDKFTDGKKAEKNK